MSHAWHEVFLRMLAEFLLLFCAPEYASARIESITKAICF